MIFLLGQNYSIHFEMGKAWLRLKLCGSLYYMCYFSPCRVASSTRTWSPLWGSTWGRSPRATWQSRSVARAGGVN